MLPRPPRSTLFPYTTSSDLAADDPALHLLARQMHHRDDRLACLLDGDPLDGQRDDLACSLVRLGPRDRKSTRLNSSHTVISYAVFCLKKKKASTQQRYYKHN